VALADQLPDLYVGVLNENFAEFSGDEVNTLRTLLRKLLYGAASEASSKEVKDRSE